MASAVIMRRGLRGLEPDNDLSRHAMSKLKLGDAVRVEIKRPRNLRWHRRYWALVSLIADNTERYVPDDIHALLKLRCGCRRLIVDSRGQHWIPDSISFNRMSHDEWVAFWDRVVEYVDTELLPGVGKETLARELADLVGVAPEAEPARAAQ
jgi:hypothetical protein